MNNQQPQPPKGLVKFPGIRGGARTKSNNHSSPYRSGTRKT
jgi:hypothetical protein